jgi:signal transduction histidine kinase
MVPGFFLSPDLFATLFPFHLAIDRNLNITHVGPILQVYYPDLLWKNNNKFNENFIIKKPVVSTDFEQILSQQDSVFFIVSRHTGVKLKGQMVHIEIDTILFLCSPIVRDTTKKDRLSLKLADFLDRDPNKDLLFRLEMQNIALAKAKQQATEITKKQIETYQELLKEQELNELKSRFINTASHEFRTPLGIISSSAGLLEDYDHKLDITKKRKHFRQIQGSVKHMTTLLEDILLINQTDAGKLSCKRSTFDLIVFCQELADELTISKDAENRIVMTLSCLDSNIDLSDGFPVWLDPKLTRQILTNLLSNGIKYSFSDSKIEFDIQINTSNIIFRVSDRGIGISEADRASLFEAFHRGSNVSNIQGTGLGLSIVKRCVDLHEGTITVTSEIGVGTTFTVNLPIAEAAACASEVSANLECDKTDSKFSNSFHELN